MKLIHGECIDVMSGMPTESVNLILCDPPYGTTQCKWDVTIPFDKLWLQYERILKHYGCIALFGSQPFTSLLISSNLKLYKYSWVWNKVNRPTGHLNSKKQPLRITEDVCIFYKNQPTYNPQMVQGVPYSTKSGKSSSNYGAQVDTVTHSDGMRYPQNLLSISISQEGRLHPTQKPVEIMEYMIKTYTNENDTVLDNCMGSGTTGIACINTKRNFIGIEQDTTYFSTAKSRLETHKTL